MLLALLQLLASIAAGALLFRLTIMAMRGPAWTRYAVAAGFLGRAVVGQVLFWISWAGLPFGAPLQLGRGLWFFAVDANLYLDAALTAAARGPYAIATADSTLPSVTFVKTLAIAAWLCGGVTSVGLLLNLFCFVGSVVVILHWAAADHLAMKRASIAVAALSLSPSAALWSLQPLKDTYFQFLLIAFVASCAALHRWWRVRGPARQFLPIAAAMTATLYALAGIRWYVGLALLFAAVILLALVFFESRGRRVLAIAGSLGLLLVLRTALVAATGPYLPPRIAAFLAPLRADAPAQPSPGIVTTVVQVREGFDRAGGATVIEPGPRLAAPPAVVRQQPPATPVRKTAEPAVAAPASGDEAEIQRLMTACASSWERGLMGPCTDLYWHSPDFVISAPERTIRGWDAARVAMQNGLQQRTRVASAPRFRRVAADRILVSGNWTDGAGTGATGPRPFVIEFRKFPGLGWKAVAVRVGAVVPITRAAPTDAAPQAAPSSDTSRHATRLLAGTAALILPQRIGAALGLFQVGGGQGLLWFTDVATLLFDALLVLACIGVVGRILRAPRDPLLWAVLAVTAILGAALAYSVPNWGTLFRLREMIFAALLLLYVASSPRQGDATVAGTAA